MTQLKLFNFDTPVTDEAVIKAWQGRADFWLTRRQIAVALMRAKTPAVNARCEAMTARGLLFRDTVKLPNGVDMIVYTPNWAHEELVRAAIDHAKTEVLF